MAGEEKTKAEQLESALPSWCHSTCTRLLACPESTGCDCSGDVCHCSGVDAGCEEQCPKAFAPYTNGDEACAVIGQRVKDCFDAVQCSDLNGPNPCPVSEAERALCPDMNGSGEDPPSAVGSGGTSTGNGPSATGGTNFTAGTASTGGSYGTGGAAAYPVSCEGSYGAGGGAPASGGSQVTCEEGRTDCTDGHDYSWICARDSQGQRACSCLIDGHTTAGFEPVMDCPDLSAVNAGCGWAMLQ